MTRPPVRSRKSRTNVPTVWAVLFPTTRLTTSRDSGSRAVWSQQSPAVGSSSEQCFCFLPTKDHFSSNCTSAVVGGKSHQRVVELLGRVSRLPDVPGDRILVDPAQPSGLPGADPLGDVGQNRHHPIRRQARGNQGRAPPLGEAGLAGGAAEQSEGLLRPIPHRHAQIPVPAFPRIRAGGILTAKPAEVIHLRPSQVWDTIPPTGFSLHASKGPYNQSRAPPTFGQAANRTLQRASEDLLAEAQRRWEETRQPQRLFDGFGYQAGTGTQPRGVIVQAEANARGTNRRFVTTNRSWARIDCEATYDEYVMRGESETRNEEFKCDLAMGRLSDHRFLAHFFRRYWHALAMNRLVRLRRVIADPPTREGASGELPLTSLPEPQRKLDPNARRRPDPSGEGQPATRRTLLIKVAASVVVSCRRVVIRWSRSWPPGEFFRQVSEHVARRPEGPR
jgi:hypothetical protein